MLSISHNEYKDALLNKKCLRLSMNGTKSKDHRIETYQSIKIPCLASIRKYISKTMDMIRSFWLLELI